MRLRADRRPNRRRRSAVGRMSRAVPALAVACLGFAGCGWLGGNDQADADEETATIDTVQVESPPLKPDAPEQKLEFRVPVGTRFPLVKTVEQALRQATPGGTVESRSRLQMQMVIVVDDVANDGSKTLSVRYHRVGYEHDIGGERLFYDSKSPDIGELPPAVQAYHGLVGNGFTFVIGPDNTFREVRDFRGFLKNCLRDVPAHRRDAVLAELEARHGDDGIANFIDDSIGILPYDVARPGRESVVSENQQWTREWKSARPIPMLTRIDYKLLHLGDEYAEILVNGKVSKSSTFGPGGQPTDSALVVVRGGYVEGHCSIRRDTGLPAQSRIRRTFDMVVRMPDGTSFDQIKDVVTTIETFQEQGSPRSVPVVVPVSASRAGGEPPVRVEHAEFESP